MNAGCFDNSFSDIISKVVGYKFNGIKKTISANKLNLGIEEQTYLMIS